MANADPLADTTGRARDIRDGYRDGDDGSSLAFTAAASALAEHSQWLLGSGGCDADDDNGGHGGDWEKVRIVQRRSRPRWRKFLFFAAVLVNILSLLLLVKLALFDSARGVADDVAEAHADDAAEAAPRPPSPPPSFRRPSSDYVLSPDWDYAAPPTVREYHWVIQNVEANPDGVFRTMTTINGRFPGELIRCNDGDTVVVHIENRAVNATSMHWHGLFQNGTNHMDGTPGATQCPIAPGRSFRYEFAVRGQAGTYFYHGHQGAEALDGLVGPFIVHARDEATTQARLVPYTTDRVVMVQDWYYDVSGSLLMEALGSGSEAPPMPNAALINGAGVVDCSLHPGRRCDNATARHAEIDLPVKENHRLRFINTGGLAWLEVTLDRHHNLSLTEIDGVNVEPSSEKSLLLAPGQRYSVVVSASATDDRGEDRGAAAFWLRARIATHCFSEYALADHDSAVALGVVRYVDASTAHEAPADDNKSLALPAAHEGPADDNKGLALPTTANDAGAFTVICRDMHTRPYRPVPALAAPAYAHQSYFLRVNLEIGNWRLQRGFFNRSSFRANVPSPVLHRAVDGLRRDRDSHNESSFRVTGVNGAAFDSQSELVLSHDAPQVVDLVLQNFDEGSHPLHLHGHQMFVLGSGGGYFPGYAAFNMAPGGRGLLDSSNRTAVENPVRRDVASVEGFGWTLVRFVADNPGVWKFHCHMTWHGDAGMALLFLSRLDLLQDWTIPAENLALCDASVEELEKGGVPKDSLWFGHTEDGQ